MKLEESSVESLNYALDDLSIENTSRFNLSDFESSAILGERELEYYGTCSALIKSLSYYFPEIPAGDVDSIDDVCINIFVCSTHSQYFISRYMLSWEIMGPHSLLMLSLLGFDCFNFSFLVYNQKDYLFMLPKSLKEILWQESVEN